MKYRNMFLLLVCVCLSALLLVGCGEYKEVQEVVPVHEHTVVTHEGQEPTCDKDGWMPYESCSTCSEYSTYAAILALGHNYSDDYQHDGDTHFRACTRCADAVDVGEHEWQSVGFTTAPTCTDKGEELFACSICGAEKTESVGALGHDYSNDHQTEGDAHVLYCARCDEELERSVHSWQSKGVTVEPGCVTEGKELFACVTCGDEKTEILPPRGHLNDIILDAVAPTCTETGLTAGVMCSVCNKYTTPHTAIPAKGHTVITDAAVAPTCTETGLSAGKHCSECGDVLVVQQVLGALGHDHSAGYQIEAESHVLCCSRCSLELYRSAHVWQSRGVTEVPGCVTEGKENFVCTACGHEKTETLASLGHLDDITFAAVDPTCTETGLTAGVKCSRCNTYTTPISTVPAKGHTLVADAAVAPTCTNTGLTAGEHCSVCNEVIVAQQTVDALGHLNDVAFDAVAPTCTETGLTAGVKCSRCNVETTPRTVVSALGHDFSEQYLPNGDVHSHFCSRCTATADDAEHAWAFVEMTKVPDCYNKGEEKYACTACGAEKLQELPEAHTSREWVTTVFPTALNAGSKLLRCSICHTELGTERIPADVESMPIIYLTGEYYNATKEKNEVEMTVEYVDPNGKSFSAYATIKVQGSSSVAYDKKNYTIKFFKDSSYEDKYKVDLGWGKENKYVMKANWVDFSQARNVVSCRIWGNIVSSRTVSENQQRLAALATNAGAIDGYPIAVYMNGSFYGLYTMNVPKDEWMFGMGEKDENGNKSTTEAIIGSDDWNHTDFYSLIGEFVEDSSGDIVAKNGGWELIYHGGDDYAWVAESFDALIKFCQENDGDAFRQGIANYLDVDAAIDYMIYMYANCMRDNASKNMLWATYDGKVWIPSVYDQDGTFGQSWDGVNFAASNAYLPYVKNGRINGGINYGPSGSNDPKFILWDRIWNSFTEEVLNRYDELRQGALSTANMLAELQAFEALIPESMFEAELEKWGESRANWWAGKNKTGTWDYTKYHYDYMYQWIEERMGYYDAAIEKIKDYYYGE